MYTFLLILLYPLSLLPMWVLYGLSGLARGVLFGIIGYRRVIVRENLEKSFPEKTPAEIARIHRDFERAFCDQWLETIKLLTISKAALNRRMPGNWELLNQAAEAGRDVYVLLGHQFNWEWAFVATQWNARCTMAGYYLPISNPAVDRLMQKLRSRGGGLLISLKNLRAGMVALKGKRFVAGLIADQNPSQPDRALWLPFMHREAPFFKGPEALARKAGAVVLFAELICHRRGQYEVRLTEAFHQPKEAAPDAIITKYVRFLEECLHRQPHNYLWSHRRWKHTRPQSG